MIRLVPSASDTDLEAFFTPEAVDFLLVDLVAFSAEIGPRSPVTLLGVVLGCCPIVEPVS